MKITFLNIGKNNDKEIQKLIERYVSRISHYVKFEQKILPDVRQSKSLSTEKQKEIEGKSILNVIGEGCFVVLLDERGKQYTSRGFAEMIERHLIRGTRDLVFVVGGPYGFSEQVYDRADDMLSLSKMTLTHEMVRLFFTEQVYRAFTIIKGENYHHD